jgi:hypothetical protein
MRGHDARLQQFQPLAEAERIEGQAQVLCALLEMGPAVGVDGHDHRICERARGLDRVVGIHGEMEGTARLRRAGKRQHHAAFEAPRDIGDAVEPGRVAADIDRGARFRAQHETDDIARQRLDARRAVPRRRRGDRQ